jgi:hypothetical protein
MIVNNVSEFYKDRNLIIPKTKPSPITKQNTQNKQEIILTNEELELLDDATDIFISKNDEQQSELLSALEESKEKIKQRFLRVLDGAYDKTRSVILENSKYEIKNQFISKFHDCKGNYEHENLKENNEAMINSIKQMFLLEHTEFYKGLLDNENITNYLRKLEEFFSYYSDDTINQMKKFKELDRILKSKEVSKYEIDKIFDFFPASKLKKLTSSKSKNDEINKITQEKKQCFFGDSKFDKIINKVLQLKKIKKTNETKSKKILKTYKDIFKNIKCEKIYLVPNDKNLAIILNFIKINNNTGCAPFYDDFEYKTEIILMDISDPKKPQELSKVRVEDLVFYITFSISGNYFFVKKKSILQSDLLFSVNKTLKKIETLPINIPTKNIQSFLFMEIDSKEKILFSTNDNKLIYYDLETSTFECQLLEIMLNHLVYINENNFLFFTDNFEMGIFSIKTRAISSMVNFERKDSFEVRNENIFGK